MKGEQLALSVQLRNSLSFDNYFAGPNAATVDALRAFVADGDGGFFLWGGVGLGKSHLLVAAARQAQQQHARIMFLPLHELLPTPDAPNRSDAAILEGFEQADIVVIDDVDHATSAEWTQALMRMLDRLRTLKRRWLVSGSSAPERLALLPDLRTRLAQAVSYGLRPLSDADRADWLRQNATQRGLQLPDESARWLLAHLPRDASSLAAAMDRLDRASLSEQRRLTLPFVQKVLQA